MQYENQEGQIYLAHIILESFVKKSIQFEILPLGMDDTQVHSPSLPTPSLR